MKKNITIIAIGVIIVLVFSFFVYKGMLVQEANEIKAQRPNQPAIKELTMENVEEFQSENIISKNGITFKTTFKDITLDGINYKNKDISIILLDNVTYEPRDKTWYERRIISINNDTKQNKIDEKVAIESYKKFVNEFDYRRAQLQNQEYNINLFTPTIELKEAKLLYKEQAMAASYDEIYEFKFEEKRGFVTVNNNDIYVISMLEPETKISAIVIMKNKGSEYNIELNDIKYIIKSFKEE